MIRQGGCAESTMPFGVLNMYFFSREREREFQSMASAPDDSSLSINQDTNQFLV